MPRANIGARRLAYKGGLLLAAADPSLPGEASDHVGHLLASDIPSGGGGLTRIVRSSTNEQEGVLQQEESGVYVTRSFVAMPRLNPHFLRRLAIRGADDQFTAADFTGPFGSTSLTRSISYAPGWLGGAAYYAYATPTESAVDEYIENPGDLPAGTTLGSLARVGNWRAAQGPYTSDELTVGSPGDFAPEEIVDIGGRPMRVRRGTFTARVSLLVPPSARELRLGRLGNWYFVIETITI